MSNIYFFFLKDDQYLQNAHDHFVHSDSFFPHRKETTCYHVQVQHGDPSSPRKALYLRFSFMLQFCFLPLGGVEAHTQAHSQPPVMLSKAMRMTPAFSGGMESCFDYEEIYQLFVEII